MFQIKGLSQNIKKFYYNKNVRIRGNIYGLEYLEGKVGIIKSHYISNNSIKFYIQLEGTNRTIWVGFNEFDLLDKIDEEIEIVTCHVCKNKLPKIFSLERKDSKGCHHICFGCLSIRPYSTRNNKLVHTPKKNMKTYGFEFECIPKDNDSYVKLCDTKYNLIPTGDSSLISGGVEFKSPTYQSLNGIRTIFQLVYDNADTKHRTCGQHINIGDIRLNGHNWRNRIIKFSSDIFDDIVKYMKLNKEQVIEVCGRNFCNYASAGRYGYDNHFSWINISHDRRIEFRLAKMQNPTQYFYLTMMYREFLDCLLNGFILKNPSNDKQNAAICSKKLVSIFKKYAEGRATCQLADKKRAEMKKNSNGS